jgi:hypothetical protein
MRSLGRKDIGWRILLKLILKEIGWEGVYWIHLAEDRDQWW